MKISVGSDHAGYNLKNSMIPLLEKAGHTVIDQGCHSADEQPFFPDVARAVCQPVVDGTAERGIMFCGTGVGASIACNKIRGIRASMIHDWHCAHQAVEHDHVQVMCIGEKIVGTWLAWDLIQAFLSAKGDETEWAETVQRKLRALEEENAPQP